MISVLGKTIDDHRKQEHAHLTPFMAFVGTVVVLSRPAWKVRWERGVPGIEDIAELFLTSISYGIPTAFPYDLHNDFLLNVGNIKRNIR